MGSVHKMGRSCFPTLRIILLYFKSNFIRFQTCLIKKFHVAQSAKIPNLPLNFLTETERWTGKETHAKGLKQIMRNCKQERTLKISFRSFFFPFECHFLVPFRCAINLSPCCKKCHFNKVFTGKCFASMHPHFCSMHEFFWILMKLKKVLRVFML